MPFLNDNNSSFIAVYYIYTVIFITILVLFITMSLRLKKGKYNIIWPVSILKYCLPIICETFFSHCFILLISIYKCYSGKLYFTSKVSCQVNFLTYFNTPLSFILIILLILLSYMTISMHYNADFIIEGNDLLKKRTAIPDLIFLLCKVITNLTFGFDHEKEYEHWGILFITCFISGLNVYCNFYLQKHENKIIQKFHDFYSLFLFWGFFCLLFCNIFRSLEFKGGFYLFLIGLILIIIYCFFYTKTYKEFLYINFSEMSSSFDCLNYIKGYLNLIKQKECSRDTSMILTSFIEKVEEKCTNKNCTLKKYLLSLTNGFDSNFLLLQYAQKLFKIALNKCPKNITLKLHYIIFLLTKINQKKNAQKELASIESNILFLDNNFKIYRCKRYIEEYNTINNVDQEENVDTNDIFQEMEYKNNIKEFKRLLSKSSSLYYDFWSSLYSSHLQGTEDFKKLNDIGAELNELIEKIEKIFQKLCEIKNNDLAMIKLYESYARNILNDKEKYEKYYNISMNLIMDNKIENREKDYSNFDLKMLNETDEYNYLIISANDENKGTIINMSLNACSILGYHKHEIIGKNMNILIPEIYHKRHNRLFNETTEKTKTEFFENLSNKVLYIPKFFEFSAYGRNKSRYLIPFDFKIFFVQTEDSELVYVVDFARKNEYNILNEDKEQLFCVLTDNNFIIQTFTSNCVEFLGLNSNIINSNYDITSFIKQFNEEFQSIISNKDFSDNETSDMKSENSKDINRNNNISDKVDRLKLKRKLIKIKYSFPRKIIWKMNNKNLESENNHVSSLFAPNKINDINEYKNRSQKRIILEVKEAHISGKHIGYYFYFRNIQLNEGNNNSNQKYGQEARSPRNKSNLKRPSAKLLIFEEEPKSSRLSKKEEEHSSPHKISFKTSNDTKKKNQIVNFDLDNYPYEKRNESAKKIIDIYDSINFVGPKYIPNCTFNFIIDLETMSFKPSIKVISFQELYNKLRYQSMEKLNIIYKNKEKKTNSSVTSNTENSSQKYFTSSSGDNSYISSSSKSNSSNDKQITILNKIDNKTRKKHRKGSLVGQNIIAHRNSNLFITNDNEGIEGQYYKVNISKIKYMIYDFNQEMVINNNINKTEKKSQMEIIIDSYKSKQNINLNEDSNYPSICFDKFIKDSKDRNNRNNDNYNRKKKTDGKSENKDMHIKEKDFEQEISYALSKKDEQKSIIFFYKISFLFFIMIILMSSYEIYFIMKRYSNLKKNLYLVINATNLRYYTNYGIYLIRENILFNINNSITGGLYNISDKNPDIYMQQIIDISKNIFIDCNSILESILGTNLDFSQDTKFILTQKPFDIEILYDQNTKIKTVTTNLFASMIQVYSSFCNLLVKYESISVDDPNVYNFIHNSYNSLGSGLSTQIQSFAQELGKRQSNIQKRVIIYSCIFFVLHILLYFIISRSYCSIVQKKASYIEVFYGIGLSLIKSSIKKCEIFINRINQEDENDKNKAFDDETSSFISSSHLDNAFLDKTFNKNLNINNNKKTKKLSKKRKLGEDKKSKKFKIITQLLLIFSFIYLLTIFCTFLILVNKFTFNGYFILYMENYHNNIIELFNGYREFLFDENNVINKLPAYEYLLNQEESFYSSNTEIINYSLTLNNVIAEFKNNLEAIQKIGLCGFYVTYFNSKEECENFMGGKDGIISLGFSIFINFFIEEIRNARNYMKKLLDDQILVGNLSNLIDINSNDTTYGLDKNKTLKFRMKVFNLEQTHSRLNIIFFNVVMQYINQEKEKTIKSVIEDIYNKHLIYIIPMIVYIFIFLLLFIFYWIPMIRRMNNEIYKTKNMLSILPLQILAAQPNIRVLLNITRND